jgi:Raf kinase inhibitor-like YbhB/YbcL family protein
MAKAFILWWLLLSLSACTGAVPSAIESQKGESSMLLTSPAFREGNTVPTDHTCDGKDSSPEIAWSGAPDGTKSFALICDDPDAPRGTWVHWVIFDLPPTTAKLASGIAPDRELSQGGKQGKNDFGKIGYGGPCPPPGKPHRYYFKLYALDTMLNLQPGATKQQVEQAMKGHILAEGTLMGKYGR